MIDYNIKDVLFFIVTIVLAMVLMIIPVPQWLLYWQPNWVLLVIVFWFCVAPEMISLFWFWSIGLFQDLLLSTPLGMSAIIYAVVVFFLSRMSSRLSQYPQWQQLTVIFMVSVFQALFSYMILHFSGQSVKIIMLLPAIILNCLIWNLLFKAMYIVWRRRLRVY